MLQPNSLPLPPPDASPGLVRQYLADILHFAHDVPMKDAKAIASNWEYGKGHALQYFDAATLRLLFGDGPGTLLHHHIAHEAVPSTGASRVVSRKEDDTTKKDLFGLPPGVSIMYMFLVACVVPSLLACIQILNGATEHVGKMLKLSAFSFIGFLYLYVMFYYVQ